MKSLKLSLFIVTTLLSLNIALSQESSEGLDTLTTKVNQMSGDLDKLKRLTVSGYFQTQYQVADSVGVSNFSGGNFAANTDKRFSIRRGRVKFVYAVTDMQFVMQIDATERGVRLMDGYGVWAPHQLKVCSLTVGQFNRPFGYEIGYSSASRETPERSRVSQTLFTNEREIGAMLTLQAPKNSPWHIFKLDAGMFNGNGSPNAAANGSTSPSNITDWDYYKDFIGHLSFSKSNRAENQTISGGVSYQRGGFRQYTQNVYSMVNGPADYSIFKADTSKSNIGKQATRRYYDVDLQYSFENPLGTTILRGEYIWGINPGVAKSTSIPQAEVKEDVYLRNFTGGNFYLVHNIKNTKHQLVVKYDWYDPNTHVSTQQIAAAGSKTGIQDLMFHTWGFGWNYKFDANVKVMLNYEIVRNETSSHLTKTNYVADLKDNIFTARVQYRF